MGSPTKEGGRRLGGWWRLWIVLSLLWAGVILGFGRSTGWTSPLWVPLDDELRAAYRSAHWASKPGVWRRPSKPDSAIRFVPVDPFYEWESGEVGDSLSRGRIDSLRVVADSAHGTKDPFVALLKAKARSARLHQAFMLFRAWALPALGLLVFGLCITWIRRGFQKREALS